MSRPLVSCLMVTRNRAALSRRAVHAFAQQTWQEKELVVVDDGDEDYEVSLAPYRATCTIRYLKLAPDPARTLGEARNLSLDAAQGEFVVQWDDDEWYHPARIATQMAALEGGYDVALLASTLWHLATPELVEHPFARKLPRGTPGTILHRKSALRYPPLRRGEDSAYLKEMRKTARVKVLRDHAHLFIRCFHGANTWGSDHFLEQLSRTFLDRVNLFIAQRVKKDLFTHPAFRLTAAERAAFEQFRRDDRTIGLG